MYNVLLAGVGGQGTVLASRLIAAAALARGEIAHTAETIGMAQRGGSVVSHVRIGVGAHSPRIPHGTADVLIGFEPAEAVRALPYLKAGGTAVVCTAAVKPVTDALNDSGYEAETMLDYLKKQDVRLVTVDGDAVVAACKTAKALNIALLGAAAAAGVLGVTVAALQGAVEGLNPRFREANLKALTLGAACVKDDLSAV
ncbi:MAG: pyruvate ferredoxin oxidoreductase [Ruminococcaceae bacterium]|nr:pyruvate ferredoxin oxidoreductase [Oscillospiraceae bacterium]